jgi:HPr kinase/phosphorylase
MTSSRPPQPKARVGELVAHESLSLRWLAGRAGEGRRVHDTRVQKTGLALVGHFQGLHTASIQVLGSTETSYLCSLTPRRCREAVQPFFALQLCCVVVTAKDELSDGVRAILAEAADATETPLLVSDDGTAATIVALHAVLDLTLAPSARIHGVLVDVFEVGLLMLGSSGVGKSEIALELVMRGHRLVADDVVECSFRQPRMVFGAPAQLLRHHLEVRGLGILNIKDLFGVTSVRDSKRIDVVVQLVEDREVVAEDRLGLEERFCALLGVEIPELSISVRPGRDMASIMEIAARRELLKAAGHHPAREFLDGIEGALLGEQPPVPAPDSRNQASLPPRGPVPRPPESSVGLPFFRKPE